MVPLLPLLVCSLFGLVAVVPIKYYHSKYDHVDVEMILNNRRMVKYYAACILNEGPCPPEGVEFKRILPEALRTNCQRCTEKQKFGTLRSIKRLKKEYPKIWAQLQNEWDPDGTYITKFENSFASSNLGPVPVIPELVINNRFGAEDIDGNTVGSSSPTTSTFSSTTTIKQTTHTSTTEPYTMSKTFTTRKITSTTRKIIKQPIASTESTQIIANKPIVISTNSNTLFSPVPVSYGPLANIGAGIQATVSLGTNIVGELVRGFGALGNRVVETGAEIAGVVLKNIARPL
ncbi:unnamed protein product [Phaedon cochleariae]|uniref:Chemosensory protein n=1 Tax=Phaedon cochleariae TaxID=80249 RepID=A0A9P0D8X5_PHACE|nr:unnamed protein product [Phaedon cochleariae]